MPRIKLLRDVVLTARRCKSLEKSCVYVLVADTKVQYPKGKSRIVYIGQTQKQGLKRIARSAALRANVIFGLHGTFGTVIQFDARVMTCGGTDETMGRLEGTVLTCFEEVFGGLPVCNSNRHQPDLDHFRRERIKIILEELS